MPTRPLTFRTASLRTFREVEDRPNAYQRGYTDRRHQAWRLAVLTRDAWQCRACGRICTDKRQAHADHVVPVAVRPDLRYVVDNGQCLCVSCHSTKTNREQNR